VIDDLDSTFLAGPMNNKLRTNLRGPDQVVV
jgi:hypothetical protein